MRVASFLRFFSHKWSKMVPSFLKPASGVTDHKTLDADEEVEESVMDQKQEEHGDARPSISSRRGSFQHPVQPPPVALAGSQNRPQSMVRKPVPHGALDRFQITIRDMEETLSQEAEKRKQLERDLEVSNQRANEYCTYWKESAGELNKYLAGGQGFQTVEDKVFREDTMRLRMRIRDLAILKFEKTNMNAEEMNRSVAEFSHILQVTVDSVWTWIWSQQKRPLLIQAYIWTLLDLDIFEQFRWGPTMYEMSELLRPVDTSDLEAKRRFQIWKATTSTLIRDSTGENSIPTVELNRKSERIYSILRPFTACKRAELLKEIAGIIEDATRLDMKIHMQASEMEWYWRRGKLLFDERIMKLEWGDPNTAKDHPISFVFAPALIRRGTSNGDDFGSEEVLLTMSVTTDRIDQIDIPPEKARRGRDFLPTLAWIFKRRTVNLIST